MTISRTEFSLGDIPSTSEWNTQFNTVYNRVNTISDGASAVNATTVDGGNLQLAANSLTSTNTDGDINITPDGTGDVVLKGTTDGVNASAGNVGEELSTITSAYVNAGATSTFSEISSLSLTAGDWLIVCSATFYANGAGGLNNRQIAFSTTTASSSGSVEGHTIIYSTEALNNSTAKTTHVMNVGRINVSSTTPYYLNGYAEYSSGTPQWAGNIIARRIR